VTAIILSEGYFLTLDAEQGVVVYTYEGRQVSTPRFNGLRGEFLNRRTVSLSNDCVAILDRSDSKTVRCFDVNNGRQVGNPITHKVEIVHLALNQGAQGIQERRLTIIDRNRDLYITPVVPQPGIFRGMYKLQTQVDSMAWNDTSDMLCAIADGRFMTWYYPNVVFVDRDLLPGTAAEKDATDFGKVPQITAFCGNRASVRRADGAVLTTCVAPHTPMLYRLAAANRWEEAIRLCRFVKDEKLWGCLAAMSLQNRQLDTAEVALASLNEADKLEFIIYLKKLPSEETRNAELALYRRCPDEAEAILLQARPPLLYRAIDLNIRLFRWGRALELAVKNKKHVDTVLGYRQKYLKQAKKTETEKRFLQYAEMEIDWEAIHAKIDIEIEDERTGRGGSIATGK